IEPFLVIAPYIEEEQDKPIALSSHEGQEFDYILSGSLKTVIDGKIKVLNAGDSIIYDSSSPHGMIATGGEKCEFLAILIK
ncbi:MAG: cupin domain-containing protein, partial [Oscillospiraceae bacterium]